ncbi:unnamed protein product [Musa acuminata subsp. malaccensis]|uniref:(wild Malaysian banana) hypothetical protein n=1 Tax=Musa acuminata subsp. malaccensis TaxID=214687 RepID=A0A804JUH5_MUSAM|nr:unnamed protein product [Musa acuminata subsp. malaccensis]
MTHSHLKEEKMIDMSYEPSSQLVKKKNLTNHFHCFCRTAWSTKIHLFPGHFRQFIHQKLTRTDPSREGAEKRKQRRRQGMDDCRPLGFLIGLPFAVLALALSLVGAVVWLLGTILGCLCPCCICFSGLANLAMTLIKMPVNVIRWFVRQIPC